MNGQYVIPTTPESQNDDNEARLLRGMSEGGQKVLTPEAQTIAYERQKNIEARIEYLRAQATEDTLSRAQEYRKKSRRIKSMSPLEVAKSALENVENALKGPIPLAERLVEFEALLGGDLFKAHADDPDDQRFYYEGGEWFYRDDADVRFLTIRYQLQSDGAVYKHVDGRLTPFVAGELHNLLQTIDTYYEVLERQLYTPQEVGPSF